MHDRDTPVIVAVDFDGVVNALPMAESDLGHFARWHQKRVMGYLLTVADEVVDWLTTLHERGGEFHWATTWTPNRHLLDEAFGLPGSAPVAADPDGPVPSVGPGISWKGAQIAALVEQAHRPLVWLDDDAVTDATAAMLDRLGTELDLPMLAVCTTMTTGLVPRQMERVDEFLGQVRAGTAPPGLAVVH